MNKLIKNKKLLLFIVTLQEAFTAIIPFFLLTAIITLLFSFLLYLHTDLWFVNIHKTRTVNSLLNKTVLFNNAHPNLIFYKFNEKGKNGETASE